MKPFIPWRPSLLGTVALGSALLVACSTAATPTPTATLPTPTIAAATTAAPAVNSTSAPPSGATSEVAPTASPTPGATATPLPSGIVSARDDVTLVVGGEPAHVNPFLSGAGIPDASFRDNVVDPLSWQSGDDQRIVPTTATTAWQQIAPNQWRFTLRQGIKFQDGELWNAQSAVPSLQFQGSLATARPATPILATTRPGRWMITMWI